MKKIDDSMEAVLRYVTAGLMQVFHIIQVSNVKLQKLKRMLPFCMDLVIAVGEPKEMKNKEEDEEQGSDDDDTYPDNPEEEKGAFYLEYH